MNSFFKNYWAVIVFGGFFAMLTLGTSLIYSQPIIWWNNQPQDLTTFLLLSSIVVYSLLAWRALQAVEFPTENVVSENYSVKK